MVEITTDDEEKLMAQVQEFCVGYDFYELWDTAILVGKYYEDFGAYAVRLVGDMRRKMRREFPDVLPAEMRLFPLRFHVAMAYREERDDEGRVVLLDVLSIEYLEEDPEAGLWWQPLERLLEDPSG